MAATAGEAPACVPLTVERGVWVVKCRPPPSCPFSDTAAELSVRYPNDALDAVIAALEFEAETPSYPKSRIYSRYSPLELFLALWRYCVTKPQRPVGECRLWRILDVTLPALVDLFSGGDYAACSRDGDRDRCLNAHILAIARTLGAYHVRGAYFHDFNRFEAAVSNAIFLHPPLRAQFAEIRRENAPP
jgi:hypothetical protein